MELPPEELKPSSPLDASRLPGETLAPGEIPPPPAHWGAEPGAQPGKPLEDVYREDEGDDALLLTDDDDVSPADEEDPEEYEYVYEDYYDEDGDYDDSDDSDSYEEYYEDYDDDAPVEEAEVDERPSPSSPRRS